MRRGCFDRDLSVFTPAKYHIFIIQLNSMDWKEQLLDDLHFFCQKLELKECFYDGNTITNKMQREERCNINTRLLNHYFYTNHEAPTEET